MEKGPVCGADASPFMKELQMALPVRNTSLEYESKNPFGTQKSMHFQKINWAPVLPQDIIWNFEFFLIDPEGKPFRRYHPFPENFIEPIKKDLAEMLK